MPELRARGRVVIHMSEPTRPYVVRKVPAFLPYPTQMPADELRQIELIRNAVSRLWAQAWDSYDDAIYDEAP